MSKKVKVIIGISIIWTVISIPLAIYGAYNNFKNVQLVNAYQNGVQATIGQLFSVAANCSIIPVVMNDKKINLIDASCVKEQAKTQPAQANPFATSTQESK